MAAPDLGSAAPGSPPSGRPQSSPGSHPPRRSGYTGRPRRWSRTRSCGSTSKRPSLLADWYQLGAHALASFAAAVPDDQPTSAQLWPEHFDLGITAARVNYGVSPGDGHIAEPYLYVGPHGGPPAAECSLR
jgi:hypothetical protein